jgi:SAM-dependent methyltransferase
MYKKIAKYYDLLGWDEFHDIAFKRLKPLLIKERVKTYLDLACGTGMLACTVARMGIEVAGIDKSKEMLEMAEERRRLYRLDNKPVFLKRDMSRFNLKRRFDAVGCFFDAANHIVDEEKFREFVRYAAMHTRPGGFFIFDVNTVRGLDKWDAVLFNQRGEHSVLMRGNYDPKTRLAQVSIEGYVHLVDGSRDNFKETFYERAYPHNDIMKELKKNGFKRVVAMPQHKGKNLRTADRVFYVAYKPEELI